MSFFSLLFSYVFLFRLLSFNVFQNGATFAVVAVDESSAYCDLTSFEEKMKIASTSTLKKAESGSTGILEVEEKKRLEKLVEKVKVLENFFLMGSKKTSDREKTIIVPAFEWAQSPDAILMNFKFSHRMSAPATLNVVEDQVNITSSEISFIMHNNKDKEFRFRLGLWNEIKAEEVTYSFGSVGRCTFTLPKKDSSLVWPRIYSEGSKKPSNMHLWYAVHEKYEDQLEELKTNNRQEKDVESGKGNNSKSEVVGNGKKEKKEADVDVAVTNEKKQEDVESKKIQKENTNEVVKSREMKSLEEKFKAEKKELKQNYDKERKYLEQQFEKEKAKLALKEKEKKQTDEL